MKILLYPLILILLTAYLGETQVSFNPFSFKMIAPYKAAGVFLIALGAVCINVHAYKRGVNDACDVLTSEIIRQGKYAENEEVK